MIKLNSDLGEAFGAWAMGDDEQIMPYIDQANIACGFHAGDPVVMQQTLALAKQHSVEIGAHPSYPDLNGFGRRSMRMRENELYQCLHYQIAALEGMANVQGLTLTYVKPHGALYNDMMREPGILQVILSAIADYPADLALMLQATHAWQSHQEQAHQVKVPLFFEAFIDRRYLPNGQLQPRTEAGSVLGMKEALCQAKQLLTEHSVQASDGSRLALKVDTLCLHGDSQGAAELASQVHAMRNQVRSTQQS